MHISLNAPQFIDCMRVSIHTPLPLPLPLVCCGNAACSDVTISMGRTQRRTEDALGGQPQEAGLGQF